MGKKQIFSETNVAIHKNDLCLIVGKNGIGKSTFLKIINKQLNGYSGEIIIDGRNINEYSVRELASKLAYLPQKLVFDTPYTVLELLEMSAYSNQAESKKIVTESISIFQIEYLQKKFITQLSGGELQRVLLASTYVVGGELMLLDEPFSFLDPGQRKKVFEKILELHEQKKRTFVMVVNSVEEMLMFEDVAGLSVYVISDGKFKHFDSFDKKFEKLFGDVFETGLKTK